MTRRICVALSLAALLPLSAAASPERDAAAPSAENAPSTQFLQRLRPLCGRAFAGRVVVDTPPSPDDPFAGKRLVMHVRDCSATQMRIPFHVGDDRSRTWILTATGPASLRLKHDHRHRDGSADALTDYGGDGAPAGADAAILRFEFPADAPSQALFRREGRSVSLTNVWALELDPARFVYELSRPGRKFRVEFDLTAAQPLPPPTWAASPETRPAQ